MAVSPVSGIGRETQRRARAGESRGRLCHRLRPEDSISEQDRQRLPSDGGGCGFCNQRAECARVSSVSRRNLDQRDETRRRVFTIKRALRAPPAGPSLRDKALGAKLHSSARWVVLAALVFDRKGDFAVGPGWEFHHIGNAGYIDRGRTAQRAARARRGFCGSRLRAPPHAERGLRR